MVGAGFGLILVWYLFRGPDISELTVQARRSLMRQRNEEASQLAHQILLHEPNHSEALMILAVACAERGMFEDALAACRRVSNPDTPQFIDARLMEGNLELEHFGRLGAAESSFERAFRAAPNNTVVLQRLSFVYSLQTREADLLPVQLAQIRAGTAGLQTLSAIVQGDLLYPDRSLVSRLLDNTPDHSGLLMAVAREQTLQKDFAAAAQTLQTALNGRPKRPEATAQLGMVLMLGAFHEKLAQWQRTLPESAYAFEQTWIALGHLAELNGQTEGAARCYWEAGRRNAASLAACYRLGKLLEGSVTQGDGREFLTRARKLEIYRKFMEEANLRPPATPEPSDLLKASELAEALGLDWEAFGFAQLAHQLLPFDAETTTTFARLQSKISTLEPTRTTPDHDPFLQLDLADLPLPEFDVPESTRNDSHDSESPPIHFLDVALESGLDFQFDNGVDPAISGAQRPYDFTGGGIGVLDLDEDLWPDLYFAQGCRLDDSTGKPRSGGCDQLRRNIRGARFDNISSIAMPPDLDYSQGISIGDINSDGFDDVLVGNLGRNRLMLNCGDGTFRDASDGIHEDAARWTTSCLIVDVNGDGHPDLYSVNYLAGDITSRVCRDSTGRLAPCAPQTFEASQDQLHLSNGDGSFSDVTESAGIVQADGKGLGIVAADLNGDGKPDLIVANDGTPNFLFLNAGRSGKVSFEEVGMPRGLAVTADGISEAGMGLVVEDFDQDGVSDVFVTNFLDESNTLYSGTPGGVFYRDVTSASGLAGPSLPMLGFGTQAIDGDLDGLPDLFIANGHVDDFTDQGVAYEMRPQLFRNRGFLRFTEQKPTDSGEYFDGSYLGRCAVKLDWNRDGAEDIVVGTLNQQTSLLQNATGSRGQSVAVRVRARTASTSAAGAVISVDAGDRQLSRPAVIGGGYLASNQAGNLIGLGHAASSVTIECQWFGATERMRGEAHPGLEYAIVAGRDRLYVLPE